MKTTTEIKTKNYGRSGNADSFVPPVCFWEPHKSQGIRHKIHTCKDRPNDVKKSLLAEWENKEAAMAFLKVSVTIRMKNHKYWR